MLIQNTKESPKINFKVQSNLPPVLNVLVDYPCNGEGNEGEVPAGHEHDGDTHEHSQQRE